MAAEGQTFQLSDPSPLGGIGFVIVDYESKTISYVKVLPNESGNPLNVFEVQNYTIPGD